eukprot:431729-Pelagomonas_calceolata.AAC.1
MDGFCCTQSDLGTLTADTVLRGLCEWSVKDQHPLIIPACLEGAFIKNKATGTQQLHLCTSGNDELQATINPVSYAHLIKMCTGGWWCRDCV